MRKLKLVAAALCGSVIAVATPALAWGPEGHTMIARVATARLGSRAAADLKWIISVGVPALNAAMQQKYGMKCQIDPADPWGPVPDYRTDHDQHTNLPNWADCYRFLEPSTAGWHFNDIPLGESPNGKLNPGARGWCAKPKGCVSLALSDNLHKLSRPGQSPADAAMALAFVVHLLGDMHQPLHEEDNGDLGGNEVLITTTGSGVKATKLHELWDTALVEYALGTDLDTATRTLKERAAPKRPLRLQSVASAISASDAWVERAHTLAQPAYALLNVQVGAGPVSNVTVTESYVKAEAPVAERQLVLAAVRLRAVLNAALTWHIPAGA
jgi:hypothetical protein